MGELIDIMSCKCRKKIKEQEEEKQQEKENQQEKDTEPEIIPESLIDVKIDVKNFIRESIKNSISNYDKIGLLGKGSYGSVYKVLKKATNQLRAMKIIPKDITKKTTEIMNEINILKELDHPNVMKIFEFFEDENNFYLVEELCDSDLKKLMDEKTIFCEFIVKYIMYQVFLAINYLHINKIVHGDIKRSNISITSLTNRNYYEASRNNKSPTRPEKKEYLLKEINDDKEICNELNNAKSIDELSPKAKYYLKELLQISIKVIDFGEADIFLVNKKKVKDIKGTLVYLSPELLKGQMIKELDEWACGILMYFLLVGEPVFEGESVDEIIDKIINSPIDFDSPKLKNFSEDCKDLLSKLLNKNYSKRITAKEALEHNFFKKGLQIDILVGGLKNTMDKNTSLNILANSFMRRRSSAHNATDIFRKTIIAYIALNFVDKEEEKQITQLFHSLASSNENKEINKETFIKNMKTATNSFTDKELEELFDDIDENKSGVIDFEELLRALSDKEKLLNNKNLKDAFDYFDRNKNGRITWDEIAEVVFQKSEKTEENEVARMFLKENYPEKSGISITFEEFCKILKE